MDKIQESAMNFLHLVDTTWYIFHVARRNVKVITLDFFVKDFHHIAGLQYLTDINIPRNRNKTIEWILDKRDLVTDLYLAESEFYHGKPNDEKDVQKRIEQLCYLEQYLDENNIIRIFSPKDGPRNNSIINCNYIIESKLKGSATTIYIFLKHRKGKDSPCCIVSFVVKKNVAYGGQNLYWMLKDKVVEGERKTIYQHPNYSDEQKINNEQDRKIQITTCFNIPKGHGA